MQKSSIKTKVIFFGTAEFAVPTLEALIKKGYEVVAVITQPDKVAGRKKVLTPPSVKLCAKSLGLGARIIQPEKLKNNLALVSSLSSLGPVVGVVAAYSKLIPPEIFNLPKHGTLNIHPSLLPKYRGPSPIQTAILNGDTETGVTIMKVDEEMDHGPILANQVLRVKNQESYKELHDRLAKLGAELLDKTLPDYSTGKIKPAPQDHSQATNTRKFTIADGEIKPDETAEQAYNKIRALNPEPGTFMWVGRDDKKLRLKILEAKLPSELGSLASKSPSTLFSLGSNLGSNLVLQLKNGYIILKTVQPEGKRPMSGQEFASGYYAFISNKL